MPRPLRGPVKNEIVIERSALSASNALPADVRVGDVLACKTR
jgi:hypothetical protein